MSRPLLLADFIDYLETVKGCTPLTAKEYDYDLMNFLRFISFRLGLDPSVRYESVDQADISMMTAEHIKLTTLQDLHAYLAYLDRIRGNSSRTRSRKISSIKTFYTYLYQVTNQIENNVSERLEGPKQRSKNPVYLTLDESKRLLSVILEQDNPFIKYRDYAFVVLFLNCGLRLSELAGIDISHFSEDRITVTGKGQKQRVIYLNQMCISAIDEYLKHRPEENEENALFLSTRKQRMSNRAIQHRIEKHIRDAGLDPKTYSTHKLRHTAATLLYKYGNVDIRVLQEILGHVSVATTQIYTHLDDEILRSAIKNNPLNKD